MAIGQGGQRGVAAWIGQASSLLQPEARTGDHHGDGGQEDFSGFRERQPADSLRHVAWKASARDSAQRPLLVKQFTGGAQSELQLDWALTSKTAPTESFNVGDNVTFVTF